jgi:hypothetical protein
MGLVFTHMYAFCVCAQVCLFGAVDPGNPYQTDKLRQTGFKPTMSLTSLAHKEFKTRVFGDAAKVLVTIVFEWVDADRSATMAVDRGVIREAVNMFQIMSACDVVTNLRNDLDTRRRVLNNLASTASMEQPSKYFMETFETPFLKLTRDHFAARAVANIGAGMPVATYIEWVYCISIEEEARCLTYLPDSTRLQVINILRDETLNKVASYVMDSATGGLKAMLNTVRDEKCGSGSGGGGSAGAGFTAGYGNIAKLYAILAGKQPVHSGASGEPLQNALQAATATWQECIITWGDAVVDKLRQQGDTVKKTDPEYVKTLIALCGFVCETLKTCFDSAEAMKRVLLRAMETTMNKFDKDHAEMLSIHADTLLRGRLGTLSEAESEEALRACLDLTQYLACKDLFREHYAALQTPRLLNRKSASSDMERLAIGHLKFLYGTHFTDKLEQMCADLAIADDAAKAYVAVQRGPGSTFPAVAPTVESFSAAVLKRATWPPMVMLKGLRLPPAMAACVNHFTRYYQSQGISRLLDWAFSQGSAEVSVQFSDKVTLTVACGTAQAVVLLVLGKVPVGTRVTVRDLADTCGIDVSTLKNIIGSMLFAKDLAVLRKTPTSKVIEEGHELELNDAYRSASRRITLPAVVMRDKSSVQEQVTAEQIHVLEAVIVRIMKARKVLPANELHSAVIGQCLFFRAEPRMIKQRIEDLMKRNYLTREDPTVHTSPFVYIPGEA